MVIRKGKKLTVQNAKNSIFMPPRPALPPLENPFDVSDEINKMYYEDPWIKPWWNHWMWNQSLGRSADNRMKLIPIDLLDTGKGYQIVTEMPGINKKNIEIVVTPNIIRICGDAETNIRKEGEGYVKKERGYSTLCRYLKFPEDVNPDDAEAILNNGILQINISKKTPLKKGILVPVK